MAGSRQEPQNREQLLAAMTASWNDCVALIDALAEEQWTSVADAQGWTVKDHVANVTAWENVVIEVFRNRSPQYATLQISQAEWLATGVDGANDLIHARKAGQSLRRVQNNRDVTHARIVTILSELPEADLKRSFNDFGAVDADQPVLVEMMTYLVRRYDDLYTTITAIVDA